MTSFSIALPVRNGADYLAPALDSVLAQEHEDFELVVSDNASTDETPAILAHYAKRDRRIRVSRSPTFLAQADNVNRTVELARGEWVKLLCHDDLLHPACLSRLAEELRHRDVDRIGLVGHDVEWLFENGHRYGPASPADSATVRHDGREVVRGRLNGGALTDLPALSNALVRRDALLEAGGFDRRYVHFDIFLWCRLLLKWDYLQVRRVLATYRIHAAQVAVSARRNLSSVEDHRRFWVPFVRETGADLGLGWRAHARARLMAIATAGAYVGVELVKGDLKSATRMVSNLPVTWWPMLPLFAARSIWSERRRTQPYRHAVPLTQIYP